MNKILYIVFASILLSCKKDIPITLSADFNIEKEEYFIEEAIYFTPYTEKIKQELETTFVDPNSNFEMTLFFEKTLKN